jgi:hypothetical protein
MVQGGSGGAPGREGGPVPLGSQDIQAMYLCCPLFSKGCLLAPQNAQVRIHALSTHTNTRAHEYPMQTHTRMYVHTSAHPTTHVHIHKWAHLQSHLHT